MILVITSQSPFYQYFQKDWKKSYIKDFTLFFEEHSILSPRQYGFRKGCLTELALLNQKEIILNNIENKLLTLGIFIDFSKASDRINYKTLLYKLELSGIRGIALKILESYLQFRFQGVVLNCQRSDSRKRNAGVPQGSILGLLLFNLFINDIANIDDVPSMIIYADDASIFFAGSDISDIMKTGNTFLEKLYAWTVQNYLVINSNKTKAVDFRAKGVKMSGNQLLCLDSRDVEIVQNVKVLGVIFN